MLRSKVCALCLSRPAVQVDPPELRLGVVAGRVVDRVRRAGPPVDGQRAAATVGGRRRVGVRQKGDLVRVLRVARAQRDASATVNRGLEAGRAAPPGLELIVPVVRDPRVASVIVMVVRVLVVRVVRGVHDRRVASVIVMVVRVLVVRVVRGVHDRRVASVIVMADRVPAVAVEDDLGLPREATLELMVASGVTVPVALQVLVGRVALVIV